MRRATQLLSAILPALALVTAFASCNPTVPDSEVTGVCAPDDLHKGDLAYFNDTMVPEIFEPYCSYCHSSDKVGEMNRKGAPASLNYDDFESARSRNVTPEQVSGFGTWVRMSDQTMPPMGRLPSTDELQMVLDWINCELAARPPGDDDDSSQ